MTIVAAGSSGHVLALQRLDQLDLELSIAGNQRTLWNSFIKSFEALSDDLAAADAEACSPVSDVAPSLPDLLRLHHNRRAIERMAIRNLIESLDSLYRALTPRQRARADLLLRPLFVSIGLGHCVGAPMRPPSVYPTGASSPRRLSAGPARFPRSGAVAAQDVGSSTDGI